MHKKQHILRYNVYMIVREEQAKQVATVYAGVLAIMALGQLVSLEKFVYVVADYSVGEGYAYAIGIFVSVGAVLALPFLLRMHAPRIALHAGRVLSICVPLVWLGLSVYANTMPGTQVNAGLLGAYIPLVPGWWTVFVSAGLVVLGVWSALGLKLRRM